MCGLKIPAQTTPISLIVNDVIIKDNYFVTITSLFPSLKLTFPFLNGSLAVALKHGFLIVMWATAPKDSREYKFKFQRDSFYNC